MLESILSVLGGAGIILAPGLFFFATRDSKKQETILALAVALVSLALAIYLAFLTWFSLLGLLLGLALLWSMRHRPDFIVREEPLSSEVNPSFLDEDRRL